MEITKEEALSLEKINSSAPYQVYGVNEKS